MNWRPAGEEEPSEELHSFSLCKVTIPAAGYMHLTEMGRLGTRKEGEWRLYGRLKIWETLTVNGSEVLPYEVGPDLHEVI